MVSKTATYVLGYGLSRFFIVTFEFSTHAEWNIQFRNRVFYMTKISGSYLEAHVLLDLKSLHLEGKSVSQSYSNLHLKSNTKGYLMGNVFFFYPVHWIILCLLDSLWFKVCYLLIDLLDIFWPKYKERDPCAHTMRWKISVEVGIYIQDQGTCF